MEAEGWITDAESADARIRRLKLTRAGREKIERAYPAWKAVQDEIDEETQLEAE